METPPNTPTHIVLVGPMGAGKSSIGRLLAARLHCAFVDLDTCIETDAGTTITEIFSYEGESGFRARESRVFRDVLKMPEACVIATGGGAVLDESNRRAMRHAGIVVYLQVEPTEQRHRLQGDDTRPLLATGNPEQRLAELQALREPLYRQASNLRFDTTHHSPQSAADALVTLLATATEHCA